MTLTNILCFLIKFSTSWKSWVKEQWTKKSLFWHFWLNIMICDSRPKEGGIYLGPWNHDRWLSQQRTHNLNMFLFLANKSGAWAGNSQSWTFETNYIQKLHFYAFSGHKQLPDDQTIPWPCHYKLSAPFSPKTTLFVKIKKISFVSIWIIHE